MTNHLETPENDRTASDAALAAAAQAGDEAAFMRLYDQHAPVAWRFGLAITGDPDEAGAALTEGFARTFTALRAGRDVPDTTFRSLLLTTVRNAAIDRRRDRDGATSAIRSFAYAADDETRMIAAAFAPLPERWRSVLWLTQVEDLRRGRSARVVGLAPQATTALAARAQRGLGEQYLQAHLERSESRNCSRSVARLGPYVSGMLDASDAEKLERHLRLCAACTERHARLHDLGRRLGLLVLPMPEALTSDTRAAWAAAVVEPARRSGTGLSATTEKVLAGVSAFAAAVGVLGATMFGATSDPGSDQRAAAPIVTDTPGGDSGTTVAPIELPAPGTIASSAQGDDSFGSAARRGTTTGAGADDTVVAASNPGGTSPAGIGHESGDPRTDAGAGSPAAVAPDPAPAVTAGTTVADQPVAVAVGEDPGATAGPISVGSEPAPSEDSNVEVDGPLEPLAPVAETVNEAADAVADVTGGLAR